MDSIDIFKRTDGRLALRSEIDGKPAETPLRVVCCFPWSHPRELISLRDDKGKELLLVERLDELEPAPRKLLEEELARSFFIPRITEIFEVHRQAELFLWRVDTTAGPRNFLTTRDEPPRNLTDGRVLIKDVSNDLYLIEDPKALSQKSWKLLWMYLD